MSKKLKIVMLVSLLLTIFSGTASALTDESKSVTLKISDNSEVENFRTTADTIGEFLTENNIELLDKDLISHPLGTRLLGDDVITIIPGFDVTVVVDGNKEEVKASTLMKTGNLISTLESEYGKNLQYDGSYAATLEPNMTMVLSSTSTETFTTTEPIPYESKTIENENLDEGITEVAVAGIEGEKQIITSVTFKEGKEDSREVTSEKITTPAVDEVIHIGTKKEIKKTSGGEFFSDASVSLDGLNIASQYTMHATAYTCEGYTGYTSSGRQAQRGVVAVDPSVIPLGTKLYIEGYGMAIAGDTGGSINGNKIDLYFNTYNECIRFGVRNINVYVLAE